MLRLKIERARVRVKGAFEGGGSLTAETIHAGCTGVETRLEIESGEDPAKITKLARAAEAGCFVIQSLRNPIPLSYQVSLNGQELDLQRGREAAGAP